MRIALLPSIIVLLAFAVCGEPVSPICEPSTSYVPSVRAEGRAEQVGQIVIVCQSLPATPAGSFNVQVSLSTPLTSRMLNATQQATEAMLLINEPYPGQSGLVCNVGEICPEGTRYYQGQKIGANSVLFAGVKLPALASPPGMGIMRILNLRADASVLPPSVTIPSSVQALIALSGTHAPVLSNVQLSLAYAQEGLGWSARKADNTAVLPVDGVHISRCVACNEALALNPQSSSAPQGAAFVIRISEKYPMAFMPQSMASSGTGDARANPTAQNNPAQIYNSESMYYEPNLTPGPGLMNMAGLARYATRFMVKFTGIPDGVSLHAPIYARLGNATNSPVRLIMADEKGDSASYVPLPAASATLGTYVSQAATYVYELTNVGAVHPYLMDSIDLPFYIAHTGKPYVNSGAIQATVSFAPVFIQDQTPSVSVPRFLPSILPKTVATIDNCPARPILSAAVTGKAGAVNARIWSVTLKNAGDGEARNARVTGFALQQTYGAACTPVIATALPIAAGTIAAGGNAILPVILDFTGCAAAARFKATIGFTADNATPGELTLYNQFR